MKQSSTLSLQTILDMASKPEDASDLSTPTYHVLHCSHPAQLSTFIGTLRPKLNNCPAHLHFLLPSFISILHSLLLSLSPSYPPAPNPSRHTCTTRTHARTHAHVYEPPTCAAV
jgi:hypothetical protein